jgi:hypothetical protein
LVSIGVILKQAAFNYGFGFIDKVS